MRLVEVMKDLQSQIDKLTEENEKLRERLGRVDAENLFRIINNFPDFAKPERIYVSSGAIMDLARAIVKEIEEGER